METVELVVSSSHRGTYTALQDSNGQTPYRKIAAVIGVIVLGVCAMAVLVGNANLSPDDSVLHSMSLSERMEAMRAIAKAHNNQMLDEAWDKENSHAYLAALEPFQKSKNPDEVKWVKAFDPKALDAEVKKYSDDIGLILKGVKDEGKLLAKFEKPDRR